MTMLFLARPPFVSELSSLRFDFFLVEDFLLEFGDCRVAMRKAALSLILLVLNLGPTEFGRWAGVGSGQADLDRNF
jgi:hypothetical protein